MPGKSPQPVQKSLHGLGKYAPRPSTLPGYKRQQREAQEQEELFKFLRRFTYLEPRFKWVHASLNGVRMPPGQAAKVKACGMIAGVWDVLTPFPGCIYRTCEADLFERPADWHYEFSEVGALYIEMKIPPNGLTEEQEGFRADLQDHFAFFIATNWLSAARAICQYLQVEHKTIREAVR